jgi:hypothetical protein
LLSCQDDEIADILDKCRDLAIVNSALYNSEYGKFKQAMQADANKRNDLKNSTSSAVESFCKDFFSDTFEDDILVLKTDEALKNTLEYTLSRHALAGSKSGKQKKNIGDPIASGQSLIAYLMKNRAYSDAIVLHNVLIETKFRDMYASYSFEDLNLPALERIEQYLLQNVSLCAFLDCLILI